MGLDIYGWVEVSLGETVPHWFSVIKVDSLLAGRGRDAWDCLFGIGGQANFAPLVGMRGIALDASSEIRDYIDDFRARYPSEPIDCSWVTWAEIQQMDWEEEAGDYHFDLVQYSRGADGQLIRNESFGSVWTQHVEIIAKVRPQQKQEADRVLRSLWDEGTYPADAPTEWEIDGKVYRRERLKRRDAFDDEWHTIFRLMEVLADRHGAERVRLSVWFGS